MNRPTYRARSRRAFTLIETAAVSALIGAGLAVTAAGVSGVRNADAHTNCSNRLLSLGAANAQFAASHNDLMAGFSWQTVGANSQYADVNALQAQPGTHNARAAQAIDLLRRRGVTDMAVISAWMADIQYWSLPLVEFQNRPLADPFNICPSHDNLNKWRRWPGAFAQKAFWPAQPHPATPGSQRWPYSSSYRLTAAAFDINQTRFTPAAVAARVSYGGSFGAYGSPPTAQLGPSAMSSVAFPSQKSHVFDSHQRHLGGTNLLYAYAASTQSILFFDGSVSTRTSQGAITPWTPNTPESPLPSSFIYQPNAWEPPTQSGQPSETVQDRFFFTRDGLLGRDFSK